MNVELNFIPEPLEQTEQLEPPKMDKLGKLASTARDRVLLAFTLAAGLASNVEAAPNQQTRELSPRMKMTQETTLAEIGLVQNPPDFIDGYIETKEIDGENGEKKQIKTIPGEVQTSAIVDLMLNDDERQDAPNISPDEYKKVILTRIDAKYQSNPKVGQAVKTFFEGLFADLYTGGTGKDPVIKITDFEGEVSSKPLVSTNIMELEALLATNAVKAGIPELAQSVDYPTRKDLYRTIYGGGWKIVDYAAEAPAERMAKKMNVDIAPNQPTTEQGSNLL